MQNNVGDPGDPSPVWTCKMDLKWASGLINIRGLPRSPGSCIAHLSQDWASRSNSHGVCCISLYNRLRYACCFKGVAQAPVSGRDSGAVAGRVKGGRGRGRERQGGNGMGE